MRYAADFTPVGFRSRLEASRVVIQRNSLSVDDYIYNVKTASKFDFGGGGCLFVF